MCKSKNVFTRVCEFEAGRCTDRIAAKSRCNKICTNQKPVCEPNRKVTLQKQTENGEAKGLDRNRIEDGKQTDCRRTNLNIYPSDILCYPFTLWKFHRIHRIFSNVSMVDPKSWIHRNPTYVNLYTSVREILYESMFMYLCTYSLYSNAIMQIFSLTHIKE